MKKLIILVVGLGLLLSVSVYSQDRTITFRKAGQMETVKAGENISIAYEDIDPEDYYLAYDAGFDGNYTLTLLINPISQDIWDILKKLAKTKSIIVSCSDEPPILSEDIISSANREVIFNHLGDTARIYTCQKVNINYGKDIKIDDVYILYQSEDWGYTIELASKKEFRQLLMDKLCKIYYIANPNLATVVVPENLRAEQVICTPMSNGYWELRLGNVNRGCKSRGLSEIDKLRSSIPNYEKNYKVDESNYQGKKK